MAVPYGENQYLYGLHDPGGEHVLKVGNTAKGWILVTEKTHRVFWRLFELTQKARALARAMQVSGTDDINVADQRHECPTELITEPVTFNNNPKEDRGYFPTSGLYRGLFSSEELMAELMQATPSRLADWYSIRGLTCYCVGELAQ